MNFERAGLLVSDLALENWEVRDEGLQLLIFRKLSQSKSPKLLDFYSFELAKLILTLQLVGITPLEQISDQLYYASEQTQFRRDSDLSELLDSLQKRKDRNSKLENIVKRAINPGQKNLSVAAVWRMLSPTAGQTQLLDIQLEGESSRPDEDSSHFLKNELIGWSSWAFGVDSRSKQLRAKQKSPWGVAIHGKDLVLHWDRNWLNIAGHVLFLMDGAVPAEGPGLRWGAKMMFSGQVEQGFFNMKSFSLQGNGIRLLRSSLMEIGFFGEDSCKLEGLGYRILVRAGEIYFGNFKEGLYENQGRWLRRDGVKYKGNFRKGMQEGEGVEICPQFSFIGHFKEGKRHGKGTFLHKNYEYEGNWKQDMRWGYGKEHWFKRQEPTDAVSYEGNFEQNRREKKGTMFYKNGAKYIGSFQNGKRHGYGVMQGDKQVYKGNWEEDQYSGEGQLELIGRSLSKGEFNHGVLHGPGTRSIFKPGTKVTVQMYTGGFKDNERSGQGKLESVPPGNYLYDGEWVSDLKHGEGFERKQEDIWGIFEQKAPQGYVDLKKEGEEKKFQEYKGHFYMGGYEGKGHLKLSNGDEYSGDFIQGKLHGMGKLTRPDGSSYDGFWKDNQPNGWLTKLFPNGDRYEGEFIAGLPHGYGSFFYQNGYLYEGHWEAGKMQGTGKLISNEKTIVYDGLFENDEYVGAAPPPPPSMVAEAKAEEKDEEAQEQDEDDEAQIPSSEEETVAPAAALIELE